MVPLIIGRARWANQGKSHQWFIFYLLDLAPTFYERPLRSYPDKWMVKTSSHFSGTSLVLFLTGEKKTSSHDNYGLGMGACRLLPCCAKEDWGKSHPQIWPFHLLSKILNYMTFQRICRAKMIFEKEFPEKYQEMLSECVSWSQKVGVIFHTKNPMKIGIIFTSKICF